MTDAPLRLKIAMCEHDASPCCMTQHIEGLAAFAPEQMGNPASGQLESIYLARQQRDTGRQELAFHARPFVLYGLPLRRPQSGQLTHARKNGKFYLQIAAHLEFGLSFGRTD